MISRRRFAMLGGSIAAALVAARFGARPAKAAPAGPVRFLAVRTPHVVDRDLWIPGQANGAEPATPDEPVSGLTFEYEDSISQAAARVVLDHGDVVREQAALIVKERERVRAALAAIPGVTAFPSDANFVLVRTHHPGRAIAASLLARGVVVRDCSRAPHLTDCLRVTIGAPEENDAFLAALAAAVGPGGAP